MSESLITSEVDFDAKGKHAGYLRLPHSVHRSAYGWIPIPVICINNGEGPTLLLMAGNHGDEYEGQAALTRLANELQAEDIQGRIILLPMANFPAAEAGTRTSPIDRGNLNRAFPGDPLGHPTWMIAHYVEEVLLPLCDYFVDLHSGGSSLYYQPTFLRGTGNSPEEVAKLALLQTAFDLPYAWIFGASAGTKSAARTSMGGASRKGVTTVMAELGGGGALDPAILARTIRGLHRIMHAVDMLPGYTPDATQGTRELEICGLIHAYDSGLFELFGDIGDMVQQDQQVGQIHFPDTPLRDPVAVMSPWSGMILCKRFIGRVARGDALLQIAADVT